MNIALNPGYNTRETIEAPTPNMVREFLKFMYLHVDNDIHDIGERNWKSDYMRKHGYTVHQVNANDFNFDKFSIPKNVRVITCFEVLEHIQNPLFFMQNIADSMDEKSVLFLSTPGRNRMFWTDHHFHEMNAAHLTKWILKPLGLQIIQKRKVRISDGLPWYFYLTGIRPLLRALANNTTIYQITKT